jgi:hypothetical protein
MFGSSVWSLLRVTLLPSRIVKSLLEFCKFAHTWNFEYFVYWQQTCRTVGSAWNNNQITVDHVFPVTFFYLYSIRSTLLPVPGFISVSSLASYFYYSLPFVYIFHFNLLFPDTVSPDITKHICILIKYWDGTRQVNHIVKHGFAYVLCTQCKKWMHNETALLKNWDLCTVRCMG